MSSSLSTSNNAALGLQDLSGNQLTRTPELKVFIGARYLWNTSIGRISASLTNSWQDEQFYRPYNTALDRVGSQSRTNANLSWTSSNGAWTIDAYAHNIDDDDDISISYDCGRKPGAGWNVDGGYRFGHRGELLPRYLDLGSAGCSVSSHPACFDTPSAAQIALFQFLLLSATKSKRLVAFAAPPWQ
jgi:hypothetical protein